MEIKNVLINNYPILDACCGGRMFYFDKHDSRVLFQDIRDVETTLCDGRHFEVKPDIQADFTNMPYPDGSFSMVVFDPPHLVYGMFPGSEARRFSDFQMERDRHQGLGGTETHTGEADIRTYLRQTQQYTLDLFYEKIIRNDCREENDTQV